MKPYDLYYSAILPAYHFLPEKLTSIKASAMLIAIALQESEIRHRQQIGGPARSYWQFETTGINPLMKHPVSRPLLQAACAQMDIRFDLGYIYSAIGYNDVLAAVLSRVSLYTLPQFLPSEDEPERGWEQYLDAWRPGKPRPVPWNGYFALAWGTLLDDSKPQLAG